MLLKVVFLIKNLIKNPTPIRIQCGGDSWLYGTPNFPISKRPNNSSYEMFTWF